MFTYPKKTPSKIICAWFSFAYLPRCFLQVRSLAIFGNKFVRIISIPLFFSIKNILTNCLIKFSSFVPYVSQTLSFVSATSELQLRSSFQQQSTIARKKDWWSEITAAKLFRNSRIWQFPGEVVSCYLWKRLQEEKEAIATLKVRTWSSRQTLQALDLLSVWLACSVVSTRSNFFVCSSNVFITNWFPRSWFLKMASGALVGFLAGITLSKSTSISSPDFTAFLVLEDAFGLDDFGVCLFSSIFAPMWNSACMLVCISILLHTFWCFFWLFGLLFLINRFCSTLPGIRNYSLRGWHLIHRIFIIFVCTVISLWLFLKLPFLSGLLINFSFMLAVPWLEQF